MNSFKQYIIISNVTAHTVLYHVWAMSKEEALEKFAQSEFLNAFSKKNGCIEISYPDEENRVYKTINDLINDQFRKYGNIDIIELGQYVENDEFDVFQIYCSPERED